MCGDLGLDIVHYKSALILIQQYTDKLLVINYTDLVDEEETIASNPSWNQTLNSAALKLKILEKTGIISIFSDELPSNIKKSLFQCIQIIYQMLGFGVSLNQKYSLRNNY